MHQGHGLWSKCMNHLKDWDGHRENEANTERDEKKRVLRQKTLSLESFFIREFFEVIRGLNWTDCERKSNSWENCEIKKTFYSLIDIVSTN